MALDRITAPAELAVSLLEMKQRLNIDSTAWDADITAAIEGAISELDGEDGKLDRCLVIQTWRYTLDAFPFDDDDESLGIRIPLAPLQSVSSVKYFNTVGAEITLVANVDYVVDIRSKLGWVMPAAAGWPATMEDGVNLVTIEFVAGYGNAAAVPPALKEIIKDKVRLRRDTMPGADREALAKDIENRMDAFRIKFYD